MNYNKFTEKTFTLPALTGISEQTVSEHLKLYAGYVKHANLILDTIAATTDIYVIGELRRRFGFEFGGIRNHEYYFEQFEGGAKEMNPDSGLCKKIQDQWGSHEAWEAEFKTLAMTRGIGWAFLYQDTVTGNLLNAWVGEQHDGHLTGLNPILALDMWEHSYMLDVPPSEKKSYVEAFFGNVNFEVVEERFQ
ncbi:MAG: Fe-Mn family superoxide dismutase [Patescibacteria group bacterium]